MGQWAQERQAARARVHKTFALKGRYFAKSGNGPGVPILVRLRSRTAQIGQLGSGGYPTSVQDVESAIFLGSDVERFGIAAGGTVKLEDGRIIRLRVKNATIDDYTAEFAVTRV